MVSGDGGSDLFVHARLCVVPVEVDSRFLDSSSSLRAHLANHASDVTLSKDILLAVWAQLFSKPEENIFLLHSIGGDDIHIKI